MATRKTAREQRARKRSDLRRTQRVRTRRHFQAQSKVFVSEPIRFRMADLENVMKRVDLEFHGLDHSGASFEARVFLNKSNANADTPKTPQNNYAGSFHVFGHGSCYGDVGHCEVKKVRRPSDSRPEHPLTPGYKRLIVTDTLRRIAQRSTRITVTVVPVVTGGDPACDFENVLKFDRLSLVTYD